MSAMAIENKENLGKGSLWMVDPVSRPKLVEALMKAPYHPYTNLDKNNSAPHLRRRSPSPVGPTIEPNCPEGSNCQDDELDDVHAAAAMLVLKHGPDLGMHISSHTREEYHKRMVSQQGLSNGYRQKEDDGNLLTRTSDDHTYSSLESGLEHVSADEAFADGSDSNSSCSLRIFEDADQEERRKTAEGADALLNLAGINTSGDGGHRLVSDTNNTLSTPSMAKRSRLLTPSNCNINNNCINNNNNNNTHHPMVPAKLRRKNACPQRVRAKR